jgi:NTP pyrophosphatase (non-canonical NTP hydrolase)
MDYDYFGKIREWANDRNLVKGSTLQAQVVKLLEESGELAAGVARNDIERIVDSIGDIMVVLTIIAAQVDMPVEECLDLAWQEIRYRKGKMVNGIFVKESDDATS